MEIIGFKNMLEILDHFLGLFRQFFIKIIGFGQNFGMDKNLFYKYLLKIIVLYKIFDKLANFLRKSLNCIMFWV